MSYAIRVSSLDHVPTTSATKLAGDKKMTGDSRCRDFPCCRVSHKALYLIAATIWVVGVVLCGIGGAEDTRRAHELGAKPASLLFVILGGVGLGLLLGHFAFSYIAKKTLDRIEMLERTYWHSSFNWRFYVFLVSINVIMRVLEKYVWYNKSAYMTYAALDLQVSVSLLYSLHVFIFNWRTFGLKNRFATGLGEPLLYANDDSDDERNLASFATPNGGLSSSVADENDPLSMKNILLGADLGGELVPEEP